MARVRAAEERDACGIGFVADARGRASRSIVEAALEALCRVKHRGAVAADAKTGDGAGVLLPLPRDLIADGLAGDEPGDPERVGVAMTFLDRADPGPGRACVERACATEGLDVVSWRTTPVDEGALGDRARVSAPLIEQAVMARPVGVDVEEGERRAFRARRRAELHAKTERISLYVASFSFKTVVYKALCAADQLAAFYGDLTDDRFDAWFAIFHQRYSTNTEPSWARAQPFRFLGHNGEINTIRGNRAQMRGREWDLGSADLAPSDLLQPVSDPAASDSASLDEAIELLVRGGRDLDHAAAMLVPSAWENVTAPPPDPEVADLFRYHACLMEPWDGPAAVVFADGDKVAARLDRNGLRPLRISVCEDGFVACASEAGAVGTRGHGRVQRLRLGPGQAFCVDPSAGGVLLDASIVGRLARRRPYGDWLEQHLERCDQGEPIAIPRDGIKARQVAAGYTKEEVTVVLRPMAVDGQEPTSSMGDDTAQPPLAQHARGVFSFLKQRFAQVTNPPIDHLRERHVMSISTRLGRRDPLLKERPEAARLRDYPSFLLFPSAVDALIAAGGRVLDASFDVAEGPEGVRDACERLATEARDAIASGVPHLIVSHVGAGPERALVPSALAAGAVHHALVKTVVRSSVSLTVDSDDARDTHQVACLVTNGADAVCPRLALESIADLAKRARLGGDVDGPEAQRRYMACVEEGLLKIMAKMGIAVIDSYRGAQVIEAIGLGDDVIDLCFDGIASPLGGLSFEELGADVLLRHFESLHAQPLLATPGFIKFKRGGEVHAFDPDVVEALQVAAGVVEKKREEAAAHALRRAVAGSTDDYQRFVELAERRDGRECEPRDLLDLRTLAPPIPLERVEPATAIATRFSTGAMSHGALSAEAHETLSVALNLIGGMANTGEGGEASERYEDERNSAIKQIASGRFGVTPAYLSHARELQIKMAQGSKPGEGGQLPGAKVTVEIARLRHTVPGVALISPPPHHDIYSIEDLAQLVFDLKQANPTAAVSVKLVSSEGIGTIAAGVVKGAADVVHIAGGDGGTGASPLASIKHAGMPWEVGLAEAHASLIANGLRTRVRLRVDGGMKTGRDVVLAALLGADEYSFGTAALVAEGCILVRTCHRNTCPVGIATQDPALRAKFAGTPEMVARYLLLVAEEVRGHLASLGLATIADAVGRTDLLEARVTGNPRTDSLDLSVLLPAPAPTRASGFTSSTELQRPRSALGDRLAVEAEAAASAGVEIVDLAYPISTADRSVGARLGAVWATRYGETRPGVLVRARFEGEAGQSFGAFISAGIELSLVGEANDHVGKGMAGGRVVVRPPANDAGLPALIGNTSLYGATGGQLFVAGRAGERFGVRNSGAVAVVEGTGDHACEYMTAGAVVILGPVGRNLGAGMSGGEAYVFDPGDTLRAHLNPQLVAAYDPTDGQLLSLRRVIERHVDVTSSAIGAEILETWVESSTAFRRVAPVAEVARLEALFEGTVVAPA
ncbi:MAG: glutamate synthase large subunit [Actinomycetota bacterium]|nr:glutamate synthase large subunit [Actinomycetota bacterium]